MKRAVAVCAGEPLASATTPASAGPAALRRNMQAMATSLQPYAASVRLGRTGRHSKSSELCRFLGYERLCCQTVREAG